MNLYSYSGPVYEFDRIVDNRWQGQTVAAAEAKAEAYTAAQKEAAAANNLWALYDAVRKAEGDKAKAKAEKAYSTLKVEVLPR